ncbi:hypothetical protein ACFFJY_15410 [Fictibacillus aquaticus]|uniref:Uncharacterized protein n=1 Tax=Fictibacillus aquaticus TaxID=2021314 RepID=A0A235FF87_9BACL|nr:hypothetical protein [Fictibacillus aquaticus]OYD59597.1 hypothetical protein CGZ90_06825 [Fictibacillus aquaticus]
MKKIYENEEELNRLVQNTSSLKSWKEFFNQKFDQFERRKLQNISFRDLAEGNEKNYSFVHIHKEYYPSLLNAGQFFDENLSGLYRFHAQIETLIKLIKFEQSYGVPPFLEATYEMTIDRLAESIYATIKKIDVSELHAQHIDLTEDSLRHFQQIFELPQRWSGLLFYLFQIGWSTLYRHSAWIEKYEEQLKEEKENKQSSLMLELALVHFAFLRKDDNEAFQKLSEIGSKAGSECLSTWLSLLLDRQEWDRMLDWLLYLQPVLHSHMKDYYYNSESREFFHDYLHYFWKYAQNTGNEDEYETMLADFLPITFYEYSEFLMVLGEVERWAELQIVMGYSPDIIQRKDLKEAKELDSKTLLPIYHQSIDKLINDRTRKSYQTAIKYLKELRSLYASQGNEERFREYIEMLSAEYSRLRAFIEELKKGKFIS